MTYIVVNQDGDEIEVQDNQLDRMRRIGWRLKGEPIHPLDVKEVEDKEDGDKSREHG